MGVGSSDGGACVSERLGVEVGIEAAGETTAWPCRFMMVLNSVGVVRLKITGALPGELIWMVNSVFLPSSGLNCVRVTFKATSSPGSTSTPEPITHLVDQVQPASLKPRRGYSDQLMAIQSMA